MARGDYFKGRHFSDTASGATSRKRFLTAAAAIAALGVTAGCQGDDDDAPRALDTEDSDIEILRFIIRLERLEEAFYDAVLASDVLAGKALSLARGFHRHEREHVKALEQLLRRLGGRPESNLRTSFPIEDQGQVLKLARKLEDLGADAYLAQLGRLRRESLANKAVSIYAVDARHAGALNELTGEGGYTPSGPFAKPLSMPKALERLEPYTR